MKDTQIEIKNNLQGNKSRVYEAKNQINDLEHRVGKNHQSEQEKKQSKKNEDSISSLWDNFKRSNIRIIEVPVEKTEQEMGSLFEIIVKENFPNLEKDMQVQKAQSPKQEGCKEAHSETHHN